MTEQVVVGIDGGGSTTRVLVTTLSGAVRGYAEAGGANPQHNGRQQAKANVREGIRRALAEADSSVSSVAALTAGFAGLNSPADAEWARSFVRLPELTCEPTCVNDAVVAHAGALETAPGIVAICGTGSVVLGVTPDGRQVRNYDLCHYARAAARHLGTRVVHDFLCGRSPGPAFADRLFDHWDVDSVAQLRDRLLADEYFSTDESGNAFDSVAPLITEGAAADHPIARDACDDALAEVISGIRAVGSYFEDGDVPVTPLGSVLRSEYMTEALRETLDTSDRFRVVEPTMSPVAGAAYMGIQRISDTEGVAEELLAHPASEP